jgi:hypothetical protein
MKSQCYEEGENNLGKETSATLINKKTEEMRFNKKKEGWKNTQNQANNKHKFKIQ